MYVLRFGIGGLFFWIMAIASVADAQATVSLPTVMISDAAVKIEHIKIVPVVQGQLSEHVDAPSIIMADARAVANIRPVGAGRVVSVSVVPGQVVKKGAVLFTYENFSFRDTTNARTSQDAMLLSAQAQAENASQLYHRAQALRGGVLSDAEIERRKAAWLAAQALVSERRAQVVELNDQIKRYSSNIEVQKNGLTNVVAPLDGVVTRINISNGQDIAADGIPPIEVTDLSSVWIVSQLDAEQARIVQKGNRQVTRLEPGGASLESRVDVIEGQVDPGTQHVQARSLVKNPTLSLRPGLLVQTRIFSSDNVTGCVIPQASLQMLGDMHVVFVRTSAQHYTAREVQIGPELDGQVVITQGLNPGDYVVAQGSFVLKAQAILAPDGAVGDNAR